MKVATEPDNIVLFRTFLLALDPDLRTNRRGTRVALYRGTKKQHGVMI